MKTRCKMLGSAGSAVLFGLLASIVGISLVEVRIKNYQQNF